MARKSKGPPPQMKKPKYKIGDIVTVTFLGMPRKCKITELKKNPQHIERWIYKAQDINDGMKIGYIGINGSEKFANIWDVPKENLDITKE